MDKIIFIEYDKQKAQKVKVPIYSIYTSDDMEAPIYFPQYNDGIKLNNLTEEDMIKFFGDVISAKISIFYNGAHGNEDKKLCLTLLTSDELNKLEKTSLENTSE